MFTPGPRISYFYQAQYCTSRCSTPGAQLSTSDPRPVRGQILFSRRRRGIGKKLIALPCRRLRRPHRGMAVRRAAQSLKQAFPHIPRRCWLSSSLSLLSCGCLAQAGSDHLVTPIQHVFPCSPRRHHAAGRLLRTWPRQTSAASVSQKDS